VAGALGAWSDPRAAEAAGGDEGDERAASDAELVARARADRRAFAALYRRYADPVYRYCYRRLGARPAAEDATSAVFTRALASLPNYRDGSFRGWLFTIAHRVVADHYRAERPAAPLADAARLPDAAPSPEEAAVAGETGRTIRGLLAALPPDQRRLLELRLAGLTDAEIARVLGRSHGAVRTAQYRTLVRLRALLGVPEEGKEDGRGA
jgi:RNA polymerase sigma-70 factor, ECF subfamily